MHHIDPEISDPQQIIDQLLLSAIRSGATHVHIEPYEAECRVRVRLNGTLKTVANLPASVASQAAHYVKAWAGMDLAARDVPQDGYMVIRVPPSRAGNHQSSVLFLVRTLPVLEGEKIVITRVQQPESEPTLDDILDARQKDAYVQALSHQQGLILVAGPTDSGKAALLYHGMRMLPDLRGEDIPMATVEWVRRGRLDTATQIVVSSKDGITFDSAMKRLADQGVKAMLVGEMHDLAAAEEAIRLTTQRRRLILSTVHTWDAPQALQRLLNLGVPGKEIAASARLVFSLRAIRKLCTTCKKPIQMPRASLIAAGFEADKAPDSLTLWEPNRQGCDRCTNGFHGRHYVCQMMLMTDEMRSALNNGAVEYREMEQIALRGGMETLQQKFLHAAIAGHIRLGDAEYH